MAPWVLVTAWTQDSASPGHILILLFASGGLWTQHFIYLGISVLIREMGAILHLPQRVGSKDKMAQSRISHTYGGTCQKCKPWGWPVILVG